MESRSFSPGGLPNACPSFTKKEWNPDRSALVFSQFKILVCIIQFSPGGLPNACPSFTKKEWNPDRLKGKGTLVCRDVAATRKSGLILGVLKCSARAGGLAWIKRLFVALIYTWLVCLHFFVLVAGSCNTTFFLCHSSYRLLYFVWIFSESLIV
uniref:Uncharacterized protein n=1 Tax=Populus alba TaxID=43335 RepID=A0A4U5PKP4_POPAL|nr:hypothetical protein D5086_0000214130 [Populus alba]